MSTSSSRYLGARLSNGLVIERFLGAGKFAWVYAARGDGEPTAVKILFRDDEQGQLRFQREIKVMRELPPNANCVGYRGHGTTDDGAPWVAMELVDGFTLQSVLRSGRCIPERAACLLMAQICDGFRELHELGLTHRDITPDNIMITHRGRQVKIMDFGLVQDSQGLLRLFEQRDVLAGRDFADDIDAGLIAGTPEYMAPEQITDPRRGARQTDTTADVFALGVVFYQLLTGRQLFPFAAGNKGFTGREGLAHYLNYRQRFGDEDLVPPANINAELWSIVRKALARDPSMRQRTASELGDDLRFYLETGQGVLDDDLSETVSQVVDVARMRSAVMSAGDFEDIRALIDAPQSEPTRPDRTVSVRERRPAPPASEQTTVERRAPRLAPDAAIQGALHRSHEAPPRHGTPAGLLVALVVVLVGAVVMLVIYLGN